jgi:hypothetical protein
MAVQAASAHAVAAITPEDLVLPFACFRFIPEPILTCFTLSISLSKAHTFCNNCNEGNAFAAR